MTCAVSKLGSYFWVFVTGGKQREVLRFSSRGLGWLCNRSKATRRMTALGRWVIEGQWGDFLSLCSVSVWGTIGQNCECSGRDGED